MWKKHYLYYLLYMVSIVDKLLNVAKSKPTKPLSLREIFKNEYSKYKKFLIFRNCVNDTRVQFKKNYAEFEKGFGYRWRGNYWRGLINLHQLTLKAIGARFELTVSVM